MSEWIEWKGGKCPVEPGTLVNWRTPYSLRHAKAVEYDHVRAPAGGLLWDHGQSEDDIIAYRIVEDQS